MDLSLQRLALLFLLILAPVQAFADSAIYAVHGIAVDATADTPAAARDKAIAQGARKGLEQLLKNLTLVDDPKSLPAITDKTAGPLVQDFDVESERSSATRYIATLGFRYKPDGVKALLAQVKSPHVSARAPLVLIVPVYRAASGDLLWQPENAWRDAWKNAADHAGLVPVVLPAGTAEDTEAFTAHDLDDNAKLLELAQRYKADNAVIVIASAISPNGDPGQGLNITLSGGGGPDTSFTSPGAPSPGATLAQGVTTTLGMLDTIWRQHVLKNASGAVAFRSDGAVESDDSAPAPVTAETDKFSGNLFALRSELSMPSQWASLRTRLAQLNGISHIELKSLTRDEVIFTVGVMGDEDRLTHALADGGIILGAPQAVPANSTNIAAMVPSNGPGAGLIYPISSTGKIQ